MQETDDRAAMRAHARRVATEVYGPRALEWDTAGCPLPDTERRRLAELGFLGLGLEAQYGGAGADLMTCLAVLEELAKVCQLAAFPVFEACTGAARVIQLLGDEEQRSRLLPPVARGDVTIAVAISEPDAGSAATDMTTRLVPVDGGYRIRGTKRWCSGAGHAEQYLVYVRLGEEEGSHSIAAVIVDRDATGLTFGPQEHLMGFRGIGSADMFFDDVLVDPRNVISPPGAFRRLFGAFGIERLGNATMSLAIAQSCVDRTTAYVQERLQFGRPIADFQMVQAALAETLVTTDAARLLIDRAASRNPHGPPDPYETSVAKCFANDAAKRVSDIAMQLHGGYGYSVEYELERLHRDAHGWALAGGTGHMQRIRIVSEHLGLSFDQRS